MLSDDVHASGASRDKVGEMAIARLELGDEAVEPVLLVRGRDIG